MAKSKRIGVAAVLAAASLLVGGVAHASPVTAATVSPSAVTSASGSLFCPQGKELYVRTTLAFVGNLKYYKGTQLVHTAHGNFHFWTYPNSGGKTTSWRVQADTNIDEVGDGCV
ncbi:hypothetical protein Q9S36_17625 [Microbacterium sp. ARD31]|uniref:hypothetical protein n=1 Tax=Microbacterium sp. ARD31 TaxID=2962576 RepID=UPI002881D7A6|nr:hypothetical protein [Microbacterium sp. ARD31]MDT0182002.1 hypothetical protein [Microbacterium sp. ARD31]